MLLVLTDGSLSTDEPGNEEQRGGGGWNGGKLKLSGEGAVTVGVVGVVGGGGGGGGC